MANFELVMPKMGESVEEATITKWFKKEGDRVEEDDVLLEIATDKVDSEIPSPVEGVIKKINYKEDDVVPVGEIIALIDMEGDAESEDKQEEEASSEKETETKKPEKDTEKGTGDYSKTSRFYSPLVRNIASKENIRLEELEQIEGTGANGRVRKQDILAYIEDKTKGAAKPETGKRKEVTTSREPQPMQVSAGAEDDIIEMDRMRRMIADHMVMSKRVSPHVTNMVEADVTGIVQWRNEVKAGFKNREKQNFTFMPVFTEAVAKSLRDYPQVNASVDGTNIILRKNINIGMAVALPTGNLIVPVIKNADQMNLVGLAREINELAEKARNNKLSPDDIQGGTFSISNFGTFKNIMGTPIINQPQVAILAVGAIQKKPAVLETPSGDVIAIRHKMFLSLTYDHRVVDGALGGSFLRKIADYLEQFDVNRDL